MEIKDFSEVSKILTRNGVGIAKLFFKMNVTIPDFCLFTLGKKMEYSKAKEVIINFSNGTKYLGSITIAGKTPYLKTSATDLKGKKFVYENIENGPESDYNFSVYLDKKYGIHPTELIFEFTNISPAGNLGTCTILDNILPA